MAAPFPAGRLSQVLLGNLAGCARTDCFLHFLDREFIYHDGFLILLQALTETMIVVEVELATGEHQMNRLELSSLLLANRLKRLESDGVIERRLYSEHPKRYEYHSTQKGKDLDPVLLALRAWSLKYERCGSKKKRPAVHLIYKETGEVIDETWSVPNGKPFHFSDAQGTMSKEWRAERDANRLAFQAGKKKAKAS